MYSYFLRNTPESCGAAEGAGVWTVGWPAARSRNGFSGQLRPSGSAPENDDVHRSLCQPPTLAIGPAPQRHRHTRTRAKRGDPSIHSVTSTSLQRCNHGHPRGAWFGSVGWPAARSRNGFSGQLRPSGSAPENDEVGMADANRELGRGPETTKRPSPIANVGDWRSTSTQSSFPDPQARERSRR
jgi:hypothetical protein